jgi:protein-S-isoprenylcysteine O-methyltransferase Ste14
LRPVVLIARGVREKLTDGYFVGLRKVGNKFADLIVERKLALLMQKQNGRSRELLADRANAVTHFGLSRYALVRHPMYMGVLFCFVGMALSLGSWWGLFVFLLTMPALIWRLFDEGKFLARSLPGYPEYQKKVRCRLIPLVW